MRSENTLVLAICGGFALLCFCTINFLLVPSKENPVSSTEDHDSNRKVVLVESPTSLSPAMQAAVPMPFDADAAANRIVEDISSTPAGKAEVLRLETKDDQLTAFQRQHRISDAIAETAIKEWVMAHGGNFDWNLEDVKAICLRSSGR